MLPNLYVSTYKEFESFICDEGVRQKTLNPLRENGHVRVVFRTLDGADTWMVPCKDKKSSVGLTEILPEVIKQLKEKGVDDFGTKFIMKYGEKVVPRYLLDEAKESHEMTKNVKSSQSGRRKAAAKHCFPEGATLEIQYEYRRTVKLWGSHICQTARIHNQIFYHIMHL